MSSILKALKKLENEKTSRKPGSFKVDAEILREGASHSFSRISLFLVAVFLFICGVVATYFYMKPVAGTGLQAGSRVVTTGNQSVVSPDTSTLAAARKQPPKEVDVHKESAPAGKQTAPSRPQSRFADKYPSPVSKSNDKSLTQPVKTLKIPVQARPNPAPAKPMETTGSRQPEHAPAPLLRVNGIAFQGKDDDNMAVVNGVTVSNGSVIEGVKVESIQKDRVRFSFKGEKFDVVLGNSNQ